MGDERATRTITICGRCGRELPEPTIDVVEWDERRRELVATMKQYACPCAFVLIEGAPE